MANNAPVKVLSRSLLVAAALAGGTAVQGQSGEGVELVSLGTNGFSANHQSGSDGVNPPRTRISGDGRYVVFESYAFNIACTDPNGSTQDVFVRDRLTGAVTTVSVAPDGGAANHNSFDPVISANGRYVAFGSQATNLVAGDTNGYIDLFLRDLQAGTTTRLSLSSAGEQPNSLAYGPAISADGRFVAFYSNASNLVAGDTNNWWDVFVRDVVASTTERISVSTAGVESACCGGVNPSITGDGRYVLFLSQGRFDPLVHNNNQEMWIRDRLAGTTTLVRPAANGSVSETGIRFADISADGRFVAFQSNSTNIVPPDANLYTHDIFVKDLADGGTTTLVSQATDGTQGNRDSWMPSISANGRYVAFHSWANNLVPGDTNTQPYYDVFLRDTLLGTTTRVNVTPSGGEADGSSATASISADGSLVYFESTATNLVPGDLVNGFQDVFLAGPRYPGAGGGGTSFRFSAAAYEVDESAGTATITVTRSGPHCATATVQYATADGSATAGADYTAASGTLTFVAGQGSRTFDVPVIADGVDEADETLQVALSGPTGGPLLGSPSVATLTIRDGDTTSNTPPNAVDDSAATPEDTPLTIDLLANDSDPDGDAMAVTAVTTPGHGGVTNNGNGTVTYTPAAHFSGTDSFAYTVGDGSGGSDTASVNVTVSPVNDAPVAAQDLYPLASNVRLVVDVAGGVLANDRDADGDPLTAEVVDAPAHGTLTFAADGSFTYAPHDGATASDRFTYRVRDPQVGSAPTIVALARVSTCRPVTPAVLHDDPNTCGGGGSVLRNPFQGNRRLTPIAADGTVPCVEVDTMEAARCVFRTAPDPSIGVRVAPPPPSGPWLEGADGRRYAVVGQPVTRDGALDSGSFIVGTEPDAEGTVPCVGASGHDAEGLDSRLPGEAIDLGATGYVEEANAEWNVTGFPLQNVATLLVGTTTLEHPDGALRVGFDPVRGIAWYTDLGAALNDPGGMERDATGTYYGADWATHLIAVNGVQVPAAKRPSTRSYPPPGVVNVNSRIRWLAANPYVMIANDAPVDPRTIPPPTASFTVSVGLNTLWVDASASTGNIAHYAWDLFWTPASPDFTTTSPTASLPLVAAGSTATSGVVHLRVVARDGQDASMSQTVTFQDRLPRHPRRRVPGPN
jgi:Tol biopolymer transport system component